MPVTPELEGPRLRLRSVVAADAAALAAIRAEAAVLRWWGVPRDGDFERPEDGDLLAIDVGGVVAGAIQFEEVTDPMYRHAGVDIFLGAAWRGRGLGREAVDVLVRYLFEQRGHHRLTIDPAVANEAAIRCYAAVGFAPVGVLRRYERIDDRDWHDNLLMELLAEEWGPSAAGSA